VTELKPKSIESRNVVAWNPIAAEGVAFSEIELIALKMLAAAARGKEDD
jgi:hypothetical protein